VKSAYALILSGGPVIYLFGSAVYRKVVYNNLPVAHLVGIVALLALISLAPIFDLPTMGWLTTIIMLLIGFWEGRLLRKRSDEGKLRATAY